MLSKDIAIFAEYFAPFAQSGIALDAREVQAIIAAANGLQAEAWWLEQQAVPASARLGTDETLPANVVRLFPGVASGGAR